MVEKIVALGDLFEVDPLGREEWQVRNIEIYGIPAQHVAILSRGNCEG